MKYNPIETAMIGVSLAVAIFVGEYLLSNNPLAKVIREKLVKTPVGTTLNLEQRTEEFTEYLVSVGTNGGRNGVYIQVDEFSDLSPTIWNLAWGDQWLTVEEPADYTAEKWNCLFNPNLRSFADENFEQEIPPEFTERRIKYGEDRMIYVRARDMESVFRFLRSYSGPSIDRLVINSHGNSAFMGETQANAKNVTLNQLLWLDQEDFSGIMGAEGQVFLESCSTLEGYEWRLTVGEYLAWLLDTPILGSTSVILVSKRGTYGPQNVGRTVSRTGEGPITTGWLNYDGTINVNVSYFGMFVVARPADVREEVEAYRRDWEWTKFQNPTGIKEIGE